MISSSISLTLSFGHQLIKMANLCRNTTTTLSSSCETSTIRFLMTTSNLLKHPIKTKLKLINKMKREFTRLSIHSIFFRRSTNQLKAWWVHVVKLKSWISLDARLWKSLLSSNGNHMLGSITILVLVFTWFTSSSLSFMSSTLDKLILSQLMTQKLIELKKKTAKSWCIYSTQWWFCV